MPEKREGSKRGIWLCEEEEEEEEAEEERQLQYCRIFGQNSIKGQCQSGCKSRTSATILRGSERTLAFPAVISE